MSDDKCPFGNDGWHGEDRVCQRERLQQEIDQLKRDPDPEFTRSALESAHLALRSIFDAVNEGTWDINHDEDCPQDDTCDCWAGHTARQANAAYHKLQTAIDRIDQASSARAKEGS